jgi:osmotically-inducible protein OsmY
MKNKPFLPAICLAAFGLLLLSACAQNGYVRRGTETVDSAAITQRVEELIATDRELAGQPIRVLTFSGTVRLSGEVASEAQRYHAERLAWAVPDVRSVQNLLIIPAR